MNKKDISFLKKMIDDDNGYFTANNVLTAVINQGEILYENVRHWINYDESESNEILSIIKKTLSGKLGKIVTEYEFSKEADNKAQDLLIRLKESNFSDKSINKEFLDTMMQNVTYVGAYAVFVVNFTIAFYDKKTENSDEITFIAAALCPITLRQDGFIYNDLENIIEKKSASERILEKTSDGFLFPTESDGIADVNHVMYYNRKASAPNLSIIEKLLGCKYVMSAERQRVNFWGMTAKILEDDLTVDMITNINEKLSNLVASSAQMSEAREIDCADMQTLLEKCGVSHDKLDTLGAVYEKTMGSRHVTMIASNLCDDKVNIKAGNTNINMDYRKTRTHLNVEMVNGRKCIVIPLDSSEVSVLGIDTKC